MNSDAMTCSYCKETLPAGAIYCSRCSHYQRPWRNEAKFWGGAAGLVALLVAALNYVWTTFSPAWLWSNEINVISVRSDQAIAIQNKGDGEIYVAHLFYSIPQLDRPDELVSKSIALVLGSGKSDTRAFERPPKAKLRADGEWEWLALPVSGFSRAVQEVAQNRHPLSACIEPVFALKNDVGIKKAQSQIAFDRDERLANLPSDGVVEYYAIRRESRQVHPIQSQIIFKLHRADCKDTAHLP